MGVGRTGAVLAPLISNILLNLNIYP